MSLYLSKILVSLGRIKNSYYKYGITVKEQEFIDSMVRPMDLDERGDN